MEELTPEREQLPESDRMKPEITVILPTFNPIPGKLERMVDSILSQSFQDYELIIVDDGSKPEVKYRIEQIARKDGRILLLRQENAGVSAARNNGLAHAAGDYIAFVDDDDIASPFFLEESRRVLIENDCDLVIGGVLRIHEENCAVPFDRQSFKVRVLEGESIREFRYPFLERSEHFLNNAYFGRGPVAKLFRRSSCTTSFPEGVRIGEDQIFILSIMNQANRVALAYRVWYLYLSYSDSATMRCSASATDDLEVLLKKISVLVDHQKMPNRIRWGNYVYITLKEAICRWFNHPDCPLSEIGKIRALSRLSRKEPWKIICEREYFMHASCHRKLRLLLFRMGLLAWALKIKAEKASWLRARKIHL